ncbi:MAG: hypothetical protein AB7L66_15760 [Gemmatimonadales bacterium]
MFRSAPFVVGSLFVASSLVAQTQSSGGGLEKAAPVVRAIEVNNRDVFGPEETTTFVARALNGLHFTTRPWVIKRELLLRPGQPYDSALVAESERGLRALRVFQSARIDSATTDSGLVLRVRTQDAFTTLPQWGGTLANGSFSNYWIGLTELNLLGSATQVSLRYSHDTDRNAVTGSFNRTRLVDGRIGVSGFYSDLSDGRAAYGVVWLPYLSLASPASWYLSGEERQGRILQFFEGDGDLTAEYERRYWMFRAGAGWALRASTAGYTRFGIETQLRRDDYALRDRADTLGRSVTGAVGAYLQWRIARFQTVAGLRGLSRVEDVDLSTTIHLGLAATPRAFGYRDDGVVPTLEVRTGLGWPSGFARLNASTQGRLIKGAAVDSGSVHLGATVVMKPSSRQLIIAHAARGWLKNPALGSEFDMGVNHGPRGFDPHAFSGDNAFLLTAEYRYRLFDRLLGLAGAGVAGFVDYGGAWYRGSPRRTGTAVGLGARFGINAASDVSAVRIDVSYTRGGPFQKGSVNWTLGKGFTFDLNGKLAR